MIELTDGSTNIGRPRLQEGLFVGRPALIGALVLLIDEYRALVKVNFTRSLRRAAILRERP
jgi:hypothetical protein